LLFLINNKLFYYNNLVQVSKHFGHSYFAPRFSGDNIFQFSDISNEPIATNQVDVNYNYLIENKKNAIKDLLLHLQPCLGDLFFEFDSLKTNDIFKFKSNLIPNNTNNVINVGIHFRGGDFNVWDPKAILPTKYYIDSIDFILSIDKDVNFKLFTDDISLQSYNDVKTYLIQNNINHEFGNINSLEDDFINLSHCDYIISSPSTFAISAGFCGKENKKIIHSQNWLDYQCDKGDKFWIGFNNGGNNNYKKYKLI
jgi:hypothetical protein